MLNTWSHCCHGNTQWSLPTHVNYKPRLGWSSVLSIYISIHIKHWCYRRRPLHTQSQEMSPTLSVTGSVPCTPSHWKHPRHPQSLETSHAYTVTGDLDTPCTPTHRKRPMHPQSLETPHAPSVTGNVTGTPSHRRRPMHTQSQDRSMSG